MTKIPQKVIEHEYFYSSLYSAKDAVDSIAMTADDREDIYGELDDMKRHFDSLYRLVKE